MTRRIEYHPLFDGDVRGHGDWLESRAPGMGNEFSAAIADALRNLPEMPEKHRHCFGPYRRVLIRRFGVLIPFRIYDDRIRVLGVVHGARDLPRWFAERTGNKE